MFGFKKVVAPAPAVVTPPVMTAEEIERIKKTREAVAETKKVLADLGYNFEW